MLISHQPQRISRSGTCAVSRLTRRDLSHSIAVAPLNGPDVPVVDIRSESACACRSPSGRDQETRRIDFRRREPPRAAQGDGLDRVGA